ncbi:hypothetical protein [Thioalkalivibrio nitratireducens]|uniref:hypothetical protein n=1 Tax=Thioalkalivibrio nitratireducens TaxID=186931 RepID=UPI0012EED408|nr:hypothetical protein [Thioalkalivibrio nitratireducens]
MANWLRVPLALKYFLAITLVQAVTVLLVLAWWHTGSTDIALTFAALGLVSGLFAALWLASMARGAHREALIRAQAHLARERERHRRLTEQERAKAAEDARRQVQRETQRVKTRSSLRMAGAVAGMAGLGTLLLLTQFLSLGVLLISSSGGAVAGYLFRIRQEMRRRDPSGNGGNGGNGGNSLPRMVPGTRLLNGNARRADTPLTESADQETRS